MSVYRINKTRLAELVERTIKKVVEADLTGVTSIGNRAFRDCTSLELITIPSSVTSIGNYAFGDCTSLTSFHINATSPPTLSSTTFTNSGITATTGTIYVPSDSLSSYQSATNWSVFADIMEGI